jgi:hypothetical protein
MVGLEALYLINDDDEVIYVLRTACTGFAGLLAREQGGGNFFIGICS